MPVQWLTAVERKPFQQFPPIIPENDLVTYFTLTPADREAVEARNHPINRLGFAVQLCALRYLGFFPEPVTDLPSEALLFLTRQLGSSPKWLAIYGTRLQTRSTHAQQIARHLGFRRFSETPLEESKAWLEDRALEHDRPLTLLRLLSERLRALKIIPPGLTEMERLIASARREAERRTWRQTAQLLTQTHRTAFDGLLVVNPELGQTPLAWLATGAVAATPTEILKVLKKIKRVRASGVLQMDLREFNPNRLKALASIGKTATNQMLQRMPPERRYPILLAFLHQISFELTDEAIDLFDHCLTEVSNRAGRELEDFRKSVAKATNEKVQYFQTLSRIVLDPAVTDRDLRPAIYQAIPPEKLKSALAECALIARPPDDSRFDLIGTRYSFLRQFIPQFLDTFNWQNARGSESLVAALATLHQLWVNGTRSLPEKPPAGFIPENWKAYVYGDSGAISKRYYELCALWELREALRSGNIWVAGSRRYADPAGYLMPAQRWTGIRDEACRMMNAPLEPASRLAHHQVELQAAAFRLEKILQQEQRPVLLDADHHLTLSPLDAETRPPSVAALDRMISDRLPLVDLAELLIEVDGWVDFNRHLTHAGSRQRCKLTALPTLYASLLAQSGNFGIARMAQMSALSEDSLIWTTNWYLREATVSPANDALVNFHHGLALTRHWGGGSLSSSDGQKFRVVVKSTTATPLPRNFGFGRGLTVYTWTSDQHSQFGTKVIPASVREATFVLDGLLDNETDLAVTTHSTDTGGYTEVIFALFSLLGLQFAPRIRDLSRQRLYRLGEMSEKRVRSLLKYTLKRDRIVNHWDELLRLAGSLKLGWCTASLLIAKLQASPRRNQLVQALQEYGRLVKTIFILQYLGDEDYRRRIQRQLNKGEALHALRQYLFAAHEGHVRKRFLDDQTTQVTCLTLVTNAVIVWNTVYMQAALDQIRSEGFQIDENDLAYLSPARFEHLNVFGKYSFPVKTELNRKGLRPLRTPKRDPQPQN